MVEIERAVAADVATASRVATSAATTLYILTKWEGEAKPRREATTAAAAATATATAVTPTTVMVAAAFISDKFPKHRYV